MHERVSLARANQYKSKASCLPCYPPLTGVPARSVQSRPSATQHRSQRFIPCVQEPEEAWEDEGSDVCESNLFEPEGFQRLDVAGRCTNVAKRDTTESADESKDQKLLPAEWGRRKAEVAQTQASSGV